MKKRIIPLLLVLILSLALCIPASAVSYIPDDVTYQNLNGTQFAIKVFTLLPDQNPAELIEDDFEYGGYLYSYADIVKEELTFSTQSQHQEIVTVETAITEEYQSADSGEYSVTRAVAAARLNVGGEDCRCEAEVVPVGEQFIIRVTVYRIVAYGEG